MILQHIVLAMIGTQQLFVILLLIISVILVIKSKSKAIKVIFGVLGAIIIIVASVIAGAYIAYTKLENETQTVSETDFDTGRIEFNPDKHSGTSEKMTVKENGIDIFIIGKQIPFNTVNYSIKKEIVTFEEAIEEPVYIVLENGQEMFNIRPKFDYDKEVFTDKIEAITVFSNKFKTVEGIGVGSSIEDFVKTYHHFKTWYSYIGGQYWIETEQYKRLRFILDENDYLKEIKFDSDLTKTELSDFKKQSKIKEIRIF